MNSEDCFNSVLSRYLYFFIIRRKSQKIPLILFWMKGSRSLLWIRTHCLFVNHNLLNGKSNLSSSKIESNFSCVLSTFFIFIIGFSKSSVSANRKCAIWFLILIHKKKTNKSLFKSFIIFRLFCHSALGTTSFTLREWCVISVFC